MDKPFHGPIPRLHPFFQPRESTIIGELFKTLVGDPEVLSLFDSVTANPCFNRLRSGRSNSQKHVVAEDFSLQYRNMSHREITDLPLFAGKSTGGQLTAWDGLHVEARIRLLIKL
jgi:hypothetical protein